MNVFVKILIGIAIWIALVTAVAAVFAGGRDPQSRQKRKSEN